MRTFFFLIKRFFAVECTRRVRVRNIIVLAMAVLIMAAVTAFGYNEALVNSQQIMFGG
jgi:hypothetical protein